MHLLGYMILQVRHLEANQLIYVLYKHALGRLSMASCALRVALY